MSCAVFSEWNESSNRQSSPTLEGVYGIFIDVSIELAPL